MNQLINKKNTKSNTQSSNFTLEANIAENACFTIIPTDSGFTDQIMQFSALYKLGYALGLSYIHTPFKASRSEAIHKKKWWQGLTNKPVDIYNYLGFNQYLIERTERSIWNDAKRVNIDIGTNFSHFEETTFSEIIQYAQEIISTFYKRNTDNKILFCFKLKANRSFFSTIHRHQQTLPNNLNFREAFLQLHKNKLDSPAFKNTGVRILLHIRQGDTAAIKTPWGTYIPVDERRSGYLQEHDTLNEINESYGNTGIGPKFKLLSINEYHSFFSSFMEKMNFKLDSTKLFSDGFNRAFDIISSFPDRLNLSEQQVKDLEKIARNYDKTQFSIFSNIKKIKCFIGERDSYLKLMVRATLEADIVIMGFQQRMLPKLLANYRFDNMPLVIVLHKGDLPDYSDIAHGWEDSFVFINIHDPDYNLLRSKLAVLDKVECNH